MDCKSTPAAFRRGRCSQPRWKSIFVVFTLGLGLMAATVAVAQTRVVIALPEDASPVEQVAAGELLSHLRVLYPSTTFDIGAANTADSVIYLGTVHDLPERYGAPVRAKLTNPDAFSISADGTGAGVAVIAGGSSRATLFAVDSLLEKLGFGFYLSYNTAPSPIQLPFSFAGWEMIDAPIAGERVIFDWHNFLSGCSTWNLVDWQNWVTQASRMRFNAVMVHAYGNNPMFSFSFNGQTKPTGYLANTEYGRDWSTEHVLDVRKIVGADDLFSGPVYGADASLVPDSETVKAAEGLMQSVFRFAAGRGMGVTLALDVDTESANPQNVISTLPASARFASHGFQLVNPDTPEGYAYYRAEIQQLMKLYPQITQVAVWFRGGFNSPWRGLKPEEFPTAWRAEYSAAIQANPRLGSDQEAPSMFAIGKIARAFRKALDETGHSDVSLATGSWRFDYLPSANVFMPPRTVLMPLDYSYQFPSDPVQESLRKIGRARPVVPIVWAQHDDREFAGRSYIPLAGFGSLLRWSNSAGYGVIHWTTRPLDLFFKNISDQVWNSSFDETLDTTALEMAKQTFGANAEDLGKRYLLDWTYDGPAFGRETTDHFLDQTIDLNNEVIGSSTRLALLARMMPLGQDALQHDWMGYYEAWEHYALDVFQAQSALQDSYSAQEAGNMKEARSAIAAARPEQAIEAYAHAIRHGKASRGEKGILISLNLRWLVYFEAQRAALGLDPLQVEFAPTHGEPLAQSPGRYTFDFDASHRPIEVLGSSELGTEVQQFEAGTKCPSGIDVRSTVTFAVGDLAGTSLAPGTYRMTLNMPEAARVEVEYGDSRQEATSTSEIEVRPIDGKVRFTLSPVSGPARVCGLTLKFQIPPE